MPRILIVDDDPDILDIIRLDLGDNPANEIECAGTAAGAMDRIHSGRAYDVIIADWRMPGMTGTDLIRKLRKDGCASFIILYSGYNMSADIRTALDCGADYYLHRGGDPDKEFAELHRLINTRRGNAPEQ